MSISPGSPPPQRCQYPRGAHHPRGVNIPGEPTTPGAHHPRGVNFQPTSGGSSAAIRSDRGGGTVTVDSGTYKTSGTGSPAVYATATIEVSNAVLTSTNSQGIVNEGGNTVILNECELNAGNATLGSQDKFRNGVFLYQSMSGDASDGASVFTMTGGEINNTYGHVFHVTNTSANITLEEVEINNSDSEGVLISVCDDAWSGLDNEAEINANDQNLEGLLLVGSGDSLTVNLSGTSTWTGTTSGKITAHRDSSSISSSLGTVDFVLSDTATITLSADTTISSLSGTGYIDYNGYTLTVGSKSYSSGDIGNVVEVSDEEAHTHEFTYEASDATITATCSADDCTLTDNKVTLTLVAPTLTTYGGSGSESASLTGLSDFNEATGKSIAETDIVYYAASKDSTTYTKSGSALDSAPTDVGDYVAEITVEDQTASVGYTISKGVGSISYATTAVSKKVGASAFVNILTHTGDGTVTYESSDTSVATVDVSTGEVTVGEVGETTITATVSGGTNYSYDTTTASYTLTVSEKEAISYTVTFKVVNGSWDDETTDDKTVTLSGFEGDTLYLTTEDIPEVGSVPDTDYEEGSWDVTPSTSTAITEDTTYTYTYKATTLEGTWVKNAKGWWYKLSDGTYPAGTFETIDEKVYYFNASGYMQTGWQKISGNWYYFAASGAMQTGWVKVSGKWYYMDTDGVMQTGWQKVGGTWYYLAASGAMQTGWQKISGNWYYFSAGGAMQTGWQKINNKWYYFYSNGSMASNTWIGNYYLSGSGAMTASK